LENGFSGSESQWLASLKGEPGPASNGLTPGSATGEMLYWDGSAWVQLSPGNRHQVLTMCDGIPMWTPEGICPGKVSSLQCLDSQHLGVLIEGFSANSVSTSFTYLGGNGGFYNSQKIFSTGVLGLEANLTSGRFENGNGTIIFEIT